MKRFRGWLEPAIQKLDLAIYGNVVGRVDDRYAASSSRTRFTSFTSSFYPSVVSYSLFPIYFSLLTSPLLHFVPAQLYLASYFTGLPNYLSKKPFQKLQE